MSVGCGRLFFFSFLPVGFFQKFFWNNPTGSSYLFVFVLLVALKKMIHSKICILSSFVWLQSVVFYPNVYPNLLLPPPQCHLSQKKKNGKLPSQQTSRTLVHARQYYSDFSWERTAMQSSQSDWCQLSVTDTNTLWSIGHAPKKASFSQTLINKWNQCKTWLYSKSK